MDENYKETIEICQEMNEKYKKGIERCKNIKEKYKNCYELYLLIQKNAKKVLMTSTSRKIISLYGMFVPDPCFVLLDEYKGRITKNENKKDFKYYFDEKDRIILTERCPNGKLLELIFYFYSENKVEFVMYSLGGKRIVELGELNYVQGKVANALYNDLVSEKYLNTDAREAMKNLYLHIQEKKQLLKKKVMFLIIYCIQTNYASTLKHLKFLMKNHKVNHLDDFDLILGQNRLFIWFTNKILLGTSLK